MRYFRLKIDIGIDISFITLFEFGYFLYSSFSLQIFAVARVISNYANSSTMFSSSLARRHLRLYLLFKIIRQFQIISGYQTQDLYVLSIGVNWPFVLPSRSRLRINVTNGRSEQHVLKLLLHQLTPTQNKERKTFHCRCNIKFAPLHHGK